MLSYVRRSRANRGSAFLLAMVALITLMFLGTSLVEVSIHGLATASRDQKNAQVLALAEAGADMVLAKMYENYDNIDTTISPSGTYSNSFALEGGTVNYSVTVPYNGIAKTCVITSTASRGGKTETVREIGTYRDDVGRVFQGVLFSNSSITLNGAVDIWPDSNGKGNSVYAGGTVDFNGSSISFMDPSQPMPDGPTGSIYATNGIAGTDPTTLYGVNPDAVYSDVARVPMPVIDLDYYKSIATQVYNGSTKFGSSGTGSGSLTGISGVIYVNGDVTISGQYSGSALIVATGSISVTGSVTTTNPSTNALALLSTKAVKISGGSEVDGLVYAHGVVTQASTTLGGNVTVKGAVVSDVITANGGITALYNKDAWSGLPIPGTGKSQWARISWEELHLP